MQQVLDSKLALAHAPYDDDGTPFDGLRASSVSLVSYRSSPLAGSTNTEGVQPEVTDLRTYLQRQIKVAERFIRIHFSFCLWAEPIIFSWAATSVTR
ncbi:hypothetical protein [Spirosoma fluviale]|uniref:Uncharacterized protein n=1 Tax=Spirosoma fluviale TaxID=1597977 RepID=A0A286G845_9BACT|nr:hypothetical protein [Spirosoma fluviale]SOD91652.1 hypothetical protein SAMN06269250_3572 [Spirosoma fluviale]